jgi:ribosomal protein S18 acetylase RimI-like enzyme
MKVRQQGDNKMIRYARKNEPEHLVKEINELTFEILRDLEIVALNDQTETKIKGFLQKLYYVDGNRFSYHNIIIKENNAHIIAIAIVYHGKDAEQLDQNFKVHLQNDFQTQQVEISKETEREEYYLDSLAVTSVHRKQGIGTELLNTVEKIALEKGYYKLSLNVEEDNAAAYRLYKKMGYEYQSIFILYGHAYFHMVKNLLDKRS